MEHTGTIAKLAENWALTDIQPINPDNSRGGSQFMARAISAKHGAGMLKYAPRHPRLPAEVATLRHFNGNGAVKVFEQAPEGGLYLMQALSPGRQLATLYHEGQDEECTRIIAGLIKTLTSQQPDTLPEDIPPVEDLWVHFTRFAKNTSASEKVRAMIVDGEAAFRSMLAQPYKPVVLHGDLHHFNILEDAHQDWLAIDPHGYIGPPIFEVGAMMKNPWPDILDAPDMTALMTRRIGILTDQLSWPAEAITQSAFVYAVISLLWDIETNDRPSDFMPVVECLWRMAA